MSKNNSVIIFSLTVTAIIAICLFITVFAILYFYWGDETAIKDALSTTGAFFGGFATLGTAVVASYLFYGWKEQHNKTVIADVAKQILINVNDDLDYLTQLTGYLRKLSPNNSLLNESIHKNIAGYLTALLGNGKKTSAQTLILFELTGDEHLEARRIGYHSGLIELSKNIKSIIDDNNSTGFLLNYIDSNMPDFLTHNKYYKIEIVSFILAKK